MLQRLKYEAVEYRLDSVIWTVSTALHPLFPDALQVASIGSLEAALAKVDAEVSVKTPSRSFGGEGGAKRVKLVDRAGSCCKIRP